MNKITELKAQKIFKHIPDGRLREILITSLAQPDKGSVVYCHFHLTRIMIREHLINCIPKNYMRGYTKVDIRFNNGHRIIFGGNNTSVRGFGFDNLYMFDIDTTPDNYLEEFKLSVYPVVECRKYGKIREYESK